MSTNKPNTPFYFTCIHPIPSVVAVAQTYANNARLTIQFGKMVAHVWLYESMTVRTSFAKFTSDAH